jgi:hypothetical protein
MSEHDCIQEKEIGKITAILEKVSKEVYGNGDAGLVKTIPRLEEKINNLVGSVASHTNVISSFIEFQATHNGEVRTKKEIEEREKIADDLKATQRRDKIQRRFLYISAILITIGLGINAYFGFRNNKNGEAINTKVDDLGVPIVTRGGEPVQIPSDVQIKFYPKDFKDSIK